MNIVIMIVSILFIVTFTTTAILIKQKTSTYDKYISKFFFSTLVLSLVLLILVLLKIIL